MFYRFSMCSRICQILQFVKYYKRNMGKPRLCEHILTQVIAFGTANNVYLKLYMQFVQLLHTYLMNIVPYFFTQNILQLISLTLHLAMQI